MEVDPDQSTLNLSTGDRTQEVDNRATEKVADAGTASEEASELSSTGDGNPDVPSEEQTQTGEPGKNEESEVDNLADPTDSEQVSNREIHEDRSHASSPQEAADKSDVAVDVNLEVGASSERQPEIRESEEDNTETDTPRDNSSEEQAVGNISEVSNSESKTAPESPKENVADIEASSDDKTQDQETEEHHSSEDNGVNTGDMPAPPPGQSGDHVDRSELDDPSLPEDLSAKIDSNRTTTDEETTDTDYNPQPEDLSVKDSVKDVSPSEEITHQATDLEGDENKKESDDHEPDMNMEVDDEPKKPESVTHDMPADAEFRNDNEDEDKSSSPKPVNDNKDLSFDDKKDGSGVSTEEMKEREDVSVSIPETSEAEKMDEDEKNEKVDTQNKEADETNDQPVGRDKDISHEVIEDENNDASQNEEGETEGKLSQKQDENNDNEEMETEMPMPDVSGDNSEVGLDTEQMKVNDAESKNCEEKVNSPSQKSEVKAHSPSLPTESNASSSVTQEPPLVLKVKKPFVMMKRCDKTLADQEGFHGFSDLDIPSFVFNNFDDVDLTAPFKFKPTIFVSLSSKKMNTSLGGGNSLVNTPDNPQKTQGASSILKDPNRPKSTKLDANAQASPRVKFADHEPTTPGAAKESLAAPATPATPTTPALDDSYTHTASSKKRVSTYFQPLYNDGWIREVVYKTFSNGKKTIDVIYHSPLVIGGAKSRKFKSPAELEAYLITSGSVYPLTFFSFRKKPLGAPEGFEIVRHIDDADNQGKARTPEDNAGEVLKSPTMGKRVSRPSGKYTEPKKLDLTPEIRSSKRVSRPTEKIVESSDSRPAKKARLSISTTPKEASTPTSLPATSINPDSWKDTENIVQSPVKSVTPLTIQLPKSGGLLKVKMFGKMKSKNVASNEPSPRSRQNDDMDDDIIFDPSSPNKKSTEVMPGLNKIGSTSNARASAHPTQLVAISQPELTVLGSPRLPIISSAYSPFMANPQAPTIPLIGPPLSVSSSPQHPLLPMPMRPGPILSVAAGMAGHANFGRNTLPYPDVRPPAVPRRPLMPCTIHCPIPMHSTQFVTCQRCQSMYHLTCAGLPLSYANKTNYVCENCEGGVSPPPSNDANILVASEDLISPQAQPPLQPVQPSSKTSSRKKTSSVAPPSRSVVPPAPTAPRPIETQTFVNIGGRRFLVIPRAPVDLDSPPPSPPTPDAGRGQSDNRLPVILEEVNRGSQTPSGANDAARFELEQTNDGNLVLKPIGACDLVSLFGARNIAQQRLPPEIRTSGVGDTSSKLAKPSADVHTTVSNGYFSLLHVFRHLGVVERLRAARVCRLWYDISHHPNTWKHVSLRGVRIHDWKSFGQFLQKKGTESIDFRKMVFVKDRDSTWQDIVNAFRSLSSVTRLDMPRVTGTVLSRILVMLPHLQRLSSQLTVSPLLTQCFSHPKELRHLTLKSSTSNLSLEGGLQHLKGLTNLKHLSLLTIESLKDADYAVIGQLTTLEFLELGNCQNASSNLFKYLSELVNLRSLRLEKGQVGGSIGSIGKLNKLKRLEILELIDVQVKRGFRDGLDKLKAVKRFLIIPSYLDEVAAINTEVVEGVTTEMRHLSAFYLGVTNEWLEAMSMAVGGDNHGGKSPGDRGCFPLMRLNRVEYISLPALYRLMCRELPSCKVKVLKMSAGATCKQFIKSLDNQQSKAK